MPHCKGAKNIYGIRSFFQKKSCRNACWYLQMLYLCESVFTETFIRLFTTQKSKKWNQLKEKKEKKILEMKEKTRKPCI